MSLPVARFAACKHAGVVRRVTHRAPHRALSTSPDTPPPPAAPAVRFSTTEFIPNHQITAYYGIAEGSTVRTKNAGHDFLAGVAAHTRPRSNCSSPTCVPSVSPRSFTRNTFCGAYIRIHALRSNAQTRPYLTPPLVLLKHWPGLKQIIGGELNSYTELLREARAEAMERLAKDAAGKGANAVVGLRLVSSSVSAGASEILAYGTAVTVKEE